MSFSVSMAPERFPKDSHNKYMIQVTETESLQVCISLHKDNITIWSTLFVYGGNYLPSRVWSALFFSHPKSTLKWPVFTCLLTEPSRAVTAMFVAWGKKFWCWVYWKSCSFVDCVSSGNHASGAILWQKKWWMKGKEDNRFWGFEWQLLCSSGNQIQFKIQSLRWKHKQGNCHWMSLAKCMTFAVGPWTHHKHLGGKGGGWVLSFNPAVEKAKKVQSFYEQRKLMSTGAREENETWDCYCEESVVISGGRSGASKIFIILPSSCQRFRTNTNKSTRTEVGETEGEN